MVVEGGVKGADDVDRGEKGGAGGGAGGAVVGGAGLLRLGVGVGGRARGWWVFGRRLGERLKGEGWVGEWQRMETGAGWDGGGKGVDEGS